MEHKAVVTVPQWVLMVVQLGNYQKETPMPPPGLEGSSWGIESLSGANQEKTTYKVILVPRHGHVPPVGVALADNTPGTQSQVTFVSTKWLPCILGAGHRKENEDEVWFRASQHHHLLREAWVTDGGRHLCLSRGFSLRQRIFGLTDNHSIIRVR